MPEVRVTLVRDLPVHQDKRVPPDYQVVQELPVGVLLVHQVLDPPVHQVLALLVYLVHRVHQVRDLRGYQDLQEHQVK